MRAVDHPWQGFMTFQYWAIPVNNYSYTPMEEQFGIFPQDNELLTCLLPLRTN